MTKSNQLDATERSDLIAQIDAIVFPAAETVTNVDDISRIEAALNRLGLRFRQSIPVWRRGK